MPKGTGRLLRSAAAGRRTSTLDGSLTGAALALSRGGSDYAHDMRSGQLKTELVALHPYLRGETASGLEFWVLGGFGDGTATHRPDDMGAAREEAELAMRMAAGGVRRRLGARGGLDFALVGSLGYLSLGTDGNGGAVAELDAGVSQGRFALEVARAGPLAPYLRVGGRADDGDGETGGGLELAAGVRHEAGRLAFEGRARALAARFNGEHGEYGVTARLAYRARDAAPRPNLGRRFKAQRPEPAAHLCQRPLARKFMRNAG